MPRTHHDDDVTLQLSIAVTSISGTGYGGLPTFGNREIKTVIRLRDGETSLLAGLIRDDERRIMDGIPGLSDLPLVGKMFSHSQRQTEQTDIVLTLTPHIVRVLDLNESDLRPFKVGRETVTLIDLPVAIPPQPPQSAEPAGPAPAPAPPPANPPTATTPGPILPPR
jgi:general secretion pathway protein D